MTISTDSKPTAPHKTKTKPPPLRFIFSSPAHFIACGFGSGLSPFAPGTAGTLFAWASFILLRPILDDSQFLLFLMLAFAFGVLACEITGGHLGEPDHSSIVWDEIVPFWTVLLLCPGHWLWQSTAFVLFRFFDIVKPPPADYFDKHIKNGFGVMCDDVFAALYTLVVLAFAKWLM